MFGKAALRDRDEEEVRGYRDALNLIHTQGADLPISEETIRQLRSSGSQTDNDIIEVFPDGAERTGETQAFMRELIEHAHFYIGPSIR